ncbi:MAG: FAD-dependent monooxygenase, partial [Bradyrhizobium sp.]|nr:FAD-dependent monooxygenase [Bradyrhizobium sp.]
MAVETSTQAPVVIVGGGPVGFGLAIDLATRGIRSVVVERHATPQPIPKGQNLTQRTMEHFHVWGAEDALRAIAAAKAAFVHWSQTRVDERLAVL